MTTPISLQRTRASARSPKAFFWNAPVSGSPPSLNVNSPFFSNPDVYILSRPIIWDPNSAHYYLANSGYPYPSSVVSLPAKTPGFDKPDNELNAYARACAYHVACCQHFQGLIRGSGAYDNGLYDGACMLNGLFVLNPNIANHFCPLFGAPNDAVAQNAPEYIAEHGIPGFTPNHGGLCAPFIATAMARVTKVIEYFVQGVKEFCDSFPVPPAYGGGTAQLCYPKYLLNDAEPFLTVEGTLAHWDWYYRVSGGVEIGRRRNVEADSRFSGEVVAATWSGQHFVQRSVSHWMGGFSSLNNIPNISIFNSQEIRDYRAKYEEMIESVVSYAHYHGVTVPWKAVLSETLCGNYNSTPLYRHPQFIWWTIENEPLRGASCLDRVFCPVLYLRNQQKYDPLMTVEKGEYQLRKARSSLWQVLCAGVPGTVIPWIEEVGESFNVMIPQQYGGPPPEYFTVSDDYMTRLLRLCHSAGVTSCVIWGNDTTGQQAESCLPALAAHRQYALQFGT